MPFNAMNKLQTSTDIFKDLKKEAIILRISHIVYISYFTLNDDKKIAIYLFMNIKGSLKQNFKKKYYSYSGVRFSLNA